MKTFAKENFLKLNVSKCEIEGVSTEVPIVILLLMDLPYSM